MTEVLVIVCLCVIFGTFAMAVVIYHPKKSTRFWAIFIAIFCTMVVTAIWLGFTNATRC